VDLRVVVGEVGEQPEGLLGERVAAVAQEHHQHGLVVRKADVFAQRRRSVAYVGNWHHLFVGVWILWLGHCPIRQESYD
jgi:hypothetical protein